MDNDEKLYIFNKLINKYPIYILKKKLLNYILGLEYLCIIQKFFKNYFFFISYYNILKMLF
jgi:hypothetical protein